MFDKAAKRSMTARLRHKVSDFRSEESGSIAVFVLILFVVMLYVGGIGVDVMRSEMRRVAYQQTADRAALAASNVVLPPSQSPVDVCYDWWDTSEVGQHPDELTVDNVRAICTGMATASSRETQLVGQVRSYNWFMHMLDVPYFEIPVETAAQQGVSKIEVLLVLDITGSMAQASGSTTKIAALREAATNFVNILKFNRDAFGNPTTSKDPNNLISIGMVPYASNVNIPVGLRNQFTVTNLSWWNAQPAQGVPNQNCFEIDPGTFDETGLSTTTPIKMAAIANIGKGNPNTANITLPQANNTNGRNGGVIALNQSGTMIPPATVYNSSSLMCNNGDDPATGADETTSNLVVMPSTNIVDLRNRIANLKAKGNTSIAVGMRWGTALMDETARPIYSALVTDGAMAGRPANNNDNDTRKIIVLMTDGDHVSSRHVVDAYKTGLSPIYRGDGDGRMAIRFTTGGPALTGGLRPGLTAGTNTCSGWVLAANREYFVPHLKANSVRRRVNAAETEGNGTGTNVAGGCDPRAWLAAPAWPGSGNVRQLDWSEVWRYASIDWMIEQLYMRSNVVGATDYEALYNTFVGNYLVNDANMDALLNTNCTAAKSAGFEVFGIVLGDVNNPLPVQNCASTGTGYYYRVTNANDLNTAFEQIAVLISELRLTQ